MAYKQPGTSRRRHHNTQCWTEPERWPRLDHHISAACWPPDAAAAPPPMPKAQTLQRSTARILQVHAAPMSDFPDSVRNPPASYLGFSASRSPAFQAAAERPDCQGLFSEFFNAERQTDHHPQHESEPLFAHAQCTARARGPGLSRPHLHPPGIGIADAGHPPTMLTSTRRRCAGHAEPTICVAVLCDRSALASLSHQFCFVGHGRVRRLLAWVSESRRDL